MSTDGANGARAGAGTSGTGGAAKVCVRCGVDCAGRPRVKDGTGRYTCRPCHDAMAAARASGGETAVAAPEPSANPLFTSSSDGGYEVADQAPAVAQITCGKCGVGRPPSMITCPSCGHNPFSEKEAPAPKERTAKGPMKGLACASCGYDMKGLKTLKCPECGHANRVSTKADFYKDVSRDVARAAYMKPAIIGAVSTLIIAGCSVSMGGGVYLLIMSILLFVGYALFWVVTQVCSYLWIGLDANLKLFSVQLFAAHAAANAVSVGLATATGGFNFSGGLFGGGLMVLLLMTMVELEKWDAIIIVFLNRVLVWGMTFGLIAAFGLK